jgi:hypothetical protein
MGHLGLPDLGTIDGTQYTHNIIRHPRLGLPIPSYFVLQQHCLFLNAHGNSLGNYPSFF